MPKKPDLGERPFKPLKKIDRVSVWNGDCTKLVPKLLKKRPKGYDFTFADPPFNIGRDYHEYNDKRADFERFTGRWLRAACEATSGVLALHGPDALVERYLERPPKLGFVRIGWVNWYYGFGQCRFGNWIDTRCHCILYARKDGLRTWNEEDILIESARKRKYNDNRTKKSERGGMIPPGTVWGIPEIDGENWGRVQGNNKERWDKKHGALVDHPNQLPELYIERLLRAYVPSGKRARVLDLFGGSGTVPTVAHALGLGCDSIEIGRQTARSLAKRVRRGAIRVAPF